jgi:ATP-dependent RNA helicase HelY
VIGSVKVPEQLVPSRRDFREQVARRLRKAKLRQASGRHPRAGAGEGGEERRSSDDHPVARDPDLREILTAAARADRARRQIAEIERTVKGKHHSLSDDFDRVIAVLEDHGYVDVEQWQLTEAGELLARLFHESDLLVAEVLRGGALDGLGAPDLAALVSCLVYEHRSSDAPPAPWFSSSDVRRRWRKIAATSSDLALRERSAGLAEHRPPDPTFAAVAFAWVAGEGFAQVVVDEELTGGDFVRTMKQLIDVLRQLALVAPDETTRRVAAAAADAAFRGVVADSSLVGVESASDAADVATSTSTTVTSSPDER